MPVRIRTMARICACLLVLTLMLILLVGLGPRLLSLSSDQLALLGRISTGLLILVGLSVVAIGGLRVSWSGFAGTQCTIEPAASGGEPRADQVVIPPWQSTLSDGN